MYQEREAKIFRNGRNQAVRIPKEFEFSVKRVIMRKVGKRLILEAAPEKNLADILDELSPMPADDIFPDVDNLEPLDPDPYCAKPSGRYGCSCLGVGVFSRPVW